MKILLTAAAFFLMAAYVFLSCSKATNPPPRNLPPIANAGADSTITQSSCSQRVSLLLDGTRSSDPEGKSLAYLWRQISGVPDVIIYFVYSPKPKVENLSVGEYAFELSVKDAAGLTSTDTVLISVKGDKPKQQDLDLSINSLFVFNDNVEDCYYRPCSYYDVTEIRGNTTLIPFGELFLYFSESADTAASKYANNSSISIYSMISNKFIYGNSSINLKKLIQQGGGAFTGSWTIQGGSATQCDPKIFDNLPPLTVTGNLDIVTGKATVSIKGKAFL